MKKSIFLSIFLALFGFDSVFAGTNKVSQTEIVNKMEAFCTNAKGSVAVFDDTCGQSCITYNRTTGKLLEQKPSQCKREKIYSCRCPETQCLKDGVCQDIVQNKQSL
jgi:hypothetical protein